MRVQGAIEESKEVREKEMRGEENKRNRKMRRKEEKIV